MLITLNKRIYRSLINIALLIISLLFLFYFIKNFLTSFHPVAEESVLFIDALRLPFLESLRELDYKYPNIPMHFIWRLSWYLSFNNLKLTIIFVRIISIFLIGYASLRTYYIILKLKKIKISREILLKFIIFLMIFFPAWNHIIYSHQIAYSFIPLLVLIIYVDLLSLTNLKEFEIYKGLWNQSSLRFIILDYSIVIFSCLNKPLLWPFCLIIFINNFLILKTFPNLIKKERLSRYLILVLIAVSFLISITLVLEGILVQDTNNVVNDIFVQIQNIDLDLNSKFSVPYLNKFSSIIHYLKRIIKSSVTIFLLSMPIVIFSYNSKKTKRKLKVFYYEFIPIVAIGILLISFHSSISLKYFRIRDFTVLAPSIIITYIYFNKIFNTDFNKRFLKQFGSVKYFLLFLLSLPWFIFVAFNLKNPFNNYIEETIYESNYFSQNDYSFNLNNQRCYYPGPRRWVGPYILNPKKNCKIYYISKFRNFIEPYEVNPEIYKKIEDMDSLLFEFNTTNDLKNLHKYDIYIESNSKLKNKKNLFFRGNIYKNKIFYQIKLENQIHPTFISLKFYDNNNKEILNTKKEVRFGIIYKIDYPRIKYNSNIYGGGNLQERINLKYPFVNLNN